MKPIFILAALARSAAEIDWPSRAKAVRGALKDSFRAYEKDASGFDDLAPVSRRGVNWLHSRATLVLSLIHI